jgi:hypothetical protein
MADLDGKVRRNGLTERNAGTGLDGSGEPSDMSFGISHFPFEALTR